MGASDERVEGEGQRRRRGSLVRLLVGVVARPRATMRAVCGERRRAWWLPALLVLALTVAPAIAQGPLVARTTRQRAVEAREESAELRGQRFTDEERAEVERAVARPLITTVLPAVSRGLRVAVVEWLAWAGLLYLASIALGSHRPFGAMLRVAIWASVPLGLRGLLQTIFVLASGQTLGSPGLAGFAPAGSVLLTTLLGGVDLFILWRLALLALGVSAASELSGSKALLATAGVWLVFAVLRLLLAFVGSAVGQQLAAA